MSLRYQAPSEITKEEFLKIVETSDVVRICQAIVDVTHFIDDYDWLRVQFKELLEHSDQDVRGVTATCIGHIARLHPSANREQLLSILRPHLSDSLICGRVEDAIDDVRMFARSGKAAPD